MMTRTLASLPLLAFAPAALALAPAALAQQRLDARTLESVELEVPLTRAVHEGSGPFAFDSTGRRLAGSVGVLDERA
jgi:hypothetical protein